MIIDTKELKIFNRKLEKISGVFPRSSSIIEDHLFQTLGWWKNEIKNYVEDSMKNTKRSGKSRADGHRPSAPGHPPAIDKGELRSRLEGEATKNPLELEFGVFGGAPYAPYLEKGTMVHSIRAKSKPVLTDGTNFFGKEVKVSMKARPFIKPAFDKFTPDIIEDLSKETVNIMHKILSRV